jgi:pimeloyl-ACP methyl ester carboxylesterase
MGPPAAPDGRPSRRPDMARGSQLTGVRSRGDPQGYLVIGLHGAPGCRLSRWPVDFVYADAGALYVTTDRAGYGQSTRRPGRNVADEAQDVLADADAMGFDRFGVIGGSPRLQCLSCSR